VFDPNISGSGTENLTRKATGFDKKVPLLAGPKILNDYYR